MPRIKVNGTEVYYEQHGEGPPLIMINGWTLSSEYWPPQLIKDLSRNHQVTIFDNRGTGRSDKPDIPYSIDMMADDVNGLMDTIKVQKAHVLGFSMGGMIAQVLALKHPEKVLSLILCGTLCGGPNAVMNQEAINFIQSVASGLAQEVPKKELMKQFMGLVFTSSYIQENIEELMKPLEYPTPLHAYQRQAQSILQFDTSERLHEIKVPALVITGEEDVMTPPGNSRDLADRISGAELRLFKDAAHMFLWEVREQATTIISDFLAKVPQK